MKNKDLFIKVLFWTLWTVIVTVCVYYLIHNAQWLIGDDAIVIRHTGFGKAFLLSDTINPSAGRFYPFSYLAYNALLLLRSDHISAKAHYVLQAVFFIIFAASVTILLLKLLESQKPMLKYILAFLAFTIFVGRVYPQYTECFATSWCGYSVLAVFMLFLFLFYNKQKWIYGIVALLCVNYYCYCGESVFVLPLSFGVCSLLFQRKTLSAKEKTFNWCLVGSALLFLTLYAVLVLPYIESAYDGAHGEEVGVLENAVRMIWAQKLLLLAFILFVVRLVDIIWNKKDYTIYDNLLLTAAACCLGNFILKLNWTLYYNVSALLVLPAILYFSFLYLKGRWTLVLFVLLAVFYGRKIPTTIQQNQEKRINTFREMTALLKSMDEVSAVYWYAPEGDSDSFELVLRDWKYVSLCTYLGWLKYDSEFAVLQKKDFQQENNTIWLTYYGNRKLFPEDMQIKGKLVFNASAIQGYYIGNKIN